MVSYILYDTLNPLIFVANLLMGIFSSLQTNFDKSTERGTRKERKVITTNIFLSIKIGHYYLLFITLHSFFSVLATILYQQYKKEKKEAIFHGKCHFCKL